MSAICKNCGRLMAKKDWEQYYGLCLKCFMEEDLEIYIKNNVDEILEEKRRNNKIGQ